MTHKNKRKKCRLTSCPASPRQPGTWWSEGSIAALHEAEKHALPMIRETEADAGGALLLLARWVQTLLAGHPFHSPESVLPLAERVIEFWQLGLYIPDPAYPYTLQESIQALRNDPAPIPDYAGHFQPFTSVAPSISCGLGEIACGLFKHHKTSLWQIWLNINGPCRYLAAYRDPIVAQRTLEWFIQLVREYRLSNVKVMELTQQVHLQGDGEIQTISYAMLTYLFSHIDRISSPSKRNRNWP